MKALIRNDGETVTENMNIGGIDWNTGAPLTNEAWCGGPYRLVNNYVPPVEEGDVETYDEPDPEPEVQVTEETVIIDGKTYTKDELRALLGE